MLVRLCSEIRCHAPCCLCLYTYAPLKTIPASVMLLNHPMDTLRGHRPKDMAIGQITMAIGQIYDIGQKLLADRHCRLPISHLFLQPAPFTVTEDKQGHGNTFARKCCAPTPLIMFETQRSVVFDPQAINHVFRCMMAKEAELHKSI